MRPQKASAEWTGSMASWGIAGHAAPGVILICEHASNHFVEPWLIDDADLLASHAASDPGALDLALALGPLLAQQHGGAELVHAPLSRLIYDLNRSPDRPDACPAQTELHHIVLNDALGVTERLARMESLYLPFHNLVRARIARALALGRRPVVLTIHSFSPTWHGLPRTVEFGVIHDDLPRLARQIVAEAGDLALKTELNAPYSAADHVTHTLRLHALPYGLDNAMLEFRNDLIATPADRAALSQRLARVLSRAITKVAEVPCPAL
ncbi:N-formylglutamate amidohydrolase [Yoonia vestfoldensis]|uniref:N-formylglutamate amidohydrolase n=1 Tax=Yoonia vestfoldensis TaxID=245188 RepID=UPI0003A33860|nr:N-formylglutamate amidohydrolase [Yoonia vestfoldensis]